MEGALSLCCRVGDEKFSAVSIKMSGRDPMHEMARRNDMEGITRWLDEGVDPAADEERLVRLMVGRCVGWTSGHVSLRCVSDAVLTVCIRVLQLSISPPARDTSPWCRNWSNGRHSCLT